MKSIVLIIAVVFVAAVAFANAAPSEGAITTTTTTSTAAPTASNSSTTPVPTTSSEASVTERHPKTLGDLLLLKLASKGYLGPPPPVYGYPYGCNPLGFCG